jgi:archaellin
MTFDLRRAPRALAALAVLIAMVASLATAGVAMAATSTITAQDCAQGTIKDKSGNAISRSRCEQLVGKNVQLASTGLDLRPIIGGGLVLLVAAAAFGLRRPGAHRLA